MSGFNKAGHGKAGHGKAWQGRARLGMAGQGLKFSVNALSNRGICSGNTGHGIFNRGHTKMKNERYLIRFTGTRPLMFDQYLGNESKAAWHEKLYMTADNHVCIPAINIFGFLCSENAKNAVKMLHGKKAAPIVQSLSVNVDIAEQYIHINGKDNQPLTDKDIDFKDAGVGQIKKHLAVARIKKTASTIVPNPKERPVISLPWSLEFNLTFEPDNNCRPAMLEEIFKFGGKRCGIGTFRPFFGTFEVEMIPIEVN